MHIHRISVGDLCRPFNLTQSSLILMLDESLLSVRGRAYADDLLMVTGDLPVTQHRRRVLGDIDFGLGDVFQRQLDSVQVLQVLVTTGKHAGQVMCVPSFWLEPVVRARR
jgi:hypothetical protein